MADKFIWLFFRLSGRIGRQVYFLAMLLSLIVAAFFVRCFIFAVDEDMLIAGGNMSLADGNMSFSTDTVIWALALWLVFPMMIWSHVALSVKRVHDLGKVGFFAVLLFIPVVSILAFITFCVIAGDPDSNQYGHQADAPDEAGG